MQDRVQQILEGDFDTGIRNLDFSCTKIELSLQAGEEYGDHFTIQTYAGGYMEGEVYSTDLRMECLTPVFSGGEAQVEFCFHGANVEEGEVIKGSFVVVSNQGEHYLPFVVTVEHRVIDSSLGPVKNLFHFANLARSSFEEAVSLFYRPEFERVLVGNDRKYLGVYRALSELPGNRYNVDEFLICANKKSRVTFQAAEDSVTVTEQDFGEPYTAEKSVTVIRGGWGPTLLKVECEGDFLFVEKTLLTDDDFLGNRCSFPVYVDRELCGAGKSFGRVHIFDEINSLFIDVTVNLRKVPLAIHDRRARIIQIMRRYLDMRLKRLSQAEWLRETKKIIEYLTVRNDRDVAARLFQAQLMISEGNTHEAEWLLEHSADILEELGDVHGVLWAYYLYLSALVHPEEAYVEQVLEELESLYRQGGGAWQIGWFLLYLDPEYGESAELRWRFLTELLEGGCTSPLIYLEAANALRDNPAHLRSVSDAMVQVLAFAAREELISDDLLEQVLYVSSKMKRYSPVHMRTLEALYEKRQDDRILQEICSGCIRAQLTGPAVFDWYRKGTLAGLKVTNLYEYYMLSVDLESRQEIPQSVLLYFAYQNRLDYLHCAYLYAYLVEHRVRYEEIYNSYLPRMEQFVAGQIAQGHISRHLAVLYDHLLKPGMITEHSAPWLCALMFANLIRVENPQIRRVLVYQQGSLRPEVYPLMERQTWIALYGNDYTVCLEDAAGNRYVQSVDYVLEKLLWPGKYQRMVQEYLPVAGQEARQSPHQAAQELPRQVLSYFLYLEEAGEGKMDAGAASRCLFLQDETWVETARRRDFMLRLVKYYFDEDHMELLDHYLDGLDSDFFTEDQRRELFRYLVLRGRWLAAFDWVVKYGPCFADEKMLLRLFEQLPEEFLDREANVCTAVAWRAFEKGRMSGESLAYLARHYKGLIRNLREIWKASEPYRLDCHRLCERMLRQMLYTGAYVGEKMDIFRSYLGGRVDRELVDAFLEQCAYDFFVKEWVMEPYAFRQMRRSFQEGERRSMLSRLAFLKYYAENPTEIEEEDGALLEQFLREAMAERIHLNFFRKFKKYRELIRDMDDKTIIEYRAQPGAKARIHFVVTREEGASRDYQTEYMRDVGGGVCFREFILFFGERLQYYIVEESADGREQLTQSGNLQQDELSIRHTGGRFDLVNDLVISKTLQDYETFDRLLEEYYYREYLNGYLFEIHS